MKLPIRYQYHRPGKGTTSYDEWLVVERPDVWVLLHEAHAGEEIAVDGKVVLARGAPVAWFVFPDGWADVGRFHDAQGKFTGWYTNLCTPVERTGRTWSSTDLYLDLWTPATGKSRWLDEPELAAAAAGKVLDHWTLSRIERERERIEALLRAGTWPPTVCRDMDLASIRGEMERST